MSPISACHRLRLRIKSCRPHIGLPETAPLLQLAEQEASTSGFYTSRSVGDEGKDGLIRPTLDTGTFDKREEAAAGDGGDGGGAQRQ